MFPNAIRYAKNVTVWIDFKWPISNILQNKEIHLNSIVCVWMDQVSFTCGLKNGISKLRSSLLIHLVYHCLSTFLFEEDLSLSLFLSRDSNNWKISFFMKFEKPCVREGWGRENMIWERDMNLKRIKEGEEQNVRNRRKGQVRKKRKENCSGLQKKKNSMKNSMEKSVRTCISWSEHERGGREKWCGVSNMMIHRQDIWC